MSTNAAQKEKFYTNKNFIILMLFFLTPIGLFLMFKYTNWNKVLKIILTPISLFYFLIYIGFIKGISENFNTDILTGSIFLILFLWILIISTTFAFVKNKNLKTIVTIVLTVIVIFGINKISKYSEYQSIQANKLQMDKSVPKRANAIGTSNKHFGTELPLRAVNNDVTGNWRLTKIWDDSLSNIQDYMLDYYQKHFKNNDEIHAIINFGLNTTNKIQILNNSIYLTIHEYVENEEYDAKDLFTGKVLAEYKIYADNGDIERIK